MLTSDQIRAGRALAQLSQVQLAERAGISVETIKRLERSTDGGVLSANAQTLDAIKRVLEAAGIELVPGGARRRTPPD
jgi:transcriptional regulator with XRE-family HTH domain